MQDYDAEMAYKEDVEKTYELPDGNFITVATDPLQANGLL